MIMGIYFATNSCKSQLSQYWTEELQTVTYSTELYEIVHRLYNAILSVCATVLEASLKLNWGQNFLVLDPDLSVLNRLLTCLNCCKPFSYHVTLDEVFPDVTSRVQAMMPLINWRSALIIVGWRILWLLVPNPVVIIFAGGRIFWL